ncbi:PEP-CTERM sorting domain-containing protein [Luteolibacter sp. Populi]|uniref:PEP-CTERM sorting domain-containing protein n=1 Tax=Luteolibacter sp. Populi TaxID=3230487 RepID=UPI003466B421
MKFALPRILALSLLAGSASGAVINFDFNLGGVDANVPLDTYVGLAAAPDSAGSGAIWNSVRRTGSTSISSSNHLNTHVGPTLTPTRDSTGVATTASVTIAGEGIGLINSHIGHQQSVGNQELGGGSLTDLMGDFIVVDSDGGNGTVGTAYGTIAGLAANAYYDIYFYGQGSANPTPGDSGDGQNSLFAITGTFGGSLVGPAEQTGWDGVNGGNGTLTEGAEFVKFSIQTNNLGEVFFMWQNVVTGPGGNVLTDAVPNGVNGGSRAGALNAIQIVSVPEPSAVLLGALGMLGVLVRRRR